MRESLERKALKGVVSFVAVTLALAMMSTWFGWPHSSAIANGELGFDPLDRDSYSWDSDWQLKNCKFKSQGENSYYIPLKPKWQFAFETTDEGRPFRKETRVLKKTEKFDLTSMGLGKFKTRVVEEKELIFEDDVWNVTQISFNYVAICKQTSSVFVFGEDTLEIDEETGELTNTEGSWRSGEVGEGTEVARPGMLMPGIVNLGTRHIFDGAPGVSLGGAHYTRTGLTVEVPAGTFTGCIDVVEYDLEDPEDVTTKQWCPGVGIVSDTSDGELTVFGKKVLD